MPLRILFNLLIIVLVGSACSTQTTKLSEHNELEPVTLDSSEIFTLYSELNQQNYRIRVRLPASYQSAPSKRYPIILKLDGQWDFLLAASAYNCIYFDGQMPETIFVGIDWGDVEGDIHAIRSRDLLHVPLPQYPQSGHADRFIQALDSEIFPALAQRLRTDGRKYLIGSSMSGTFAAYAILKSPQSFDGAIAIGPNFNIGRTELEELIKSRNGSSDLQGKKLYIGAGKHDAIEPRAREVAQQIMASKLTGFELRYDNPDDFGHSGMNIPGFAGGYQFLFKRPDLNLKQSELAVYEGTYYSPTEPKNWLKVRSNGTALEVTSHHGRTLTFKAQSVNQFYLPGEFMNLKFVDGFAHVETFFGKSTYSKK